ncbi:MAG: type VII toxin-antitoxin system MntA family adenylyltransferase antitoxin [Anaerolineae bacterium]
MSGFPFDVDILIELCRQSGVVRILLFGSMARGEADEESDIDLLVEFSKPISLLRLVALERELSDALGRKVDVLTKAAISPYLRERIRSEAQVIYEAR